MVWSENKDSCQIWSRIFQFNESFYDLHSFFSLILRNDHFKNGILLPKLSWPTVRNNCSSDREQLLKFEAEGREFAKLLRSLEQFFQTVKGQNNFL